MDLQKTAAAAKFAEYCTCILVYNCIKPISSQTPADFIDNAKN